MTPKKFNPIPIEKQRENRHYCNCCGEKMSEGFCINGGEEYYCSDVCIQSQYTVGQYKELYDNGNSDTYWTEWEEEPKVKTLAQTLCDKLLDVNRFAYGIEM
jgi:hypothetical protein